MPYNREEGKKSGKLFILLSLYFLRGGVHMQKESEFQHNLIKEIKEMLPGCIIMKNDPKYIQGIPDWIIIYEDKWAALECKRSSKSHHQPNQDYYISKMNRMSYASFVFPENKAEVLHELQQALQPSGTTRVP
jgi:hypothetical protein